MMGLLQFQDSTGGEGVGIVDEYHLWFRNLGDYFAFLERVKLHFQE